MEQCNSIKISEYLYKCSKCGFEYHTSFSKFCIQSISEIHKQTPYQCIHTGKVEETLDTKNCNCTSRGTEITIHHCNLHNKQCGLLQLLKYNKRKELATRGVIDCMSCANRFDKQENTENDQKGV